MSSLVADAVASERSEGPLDERPLTDEERKFVARLLSDPFAFPQTFKTWLVSFLESSDLTLPISSIQGLSSTLGLGSGGNKNFIKGLLPAGCIIPWSASRIPSGSLRCNGAAYSRTAYKALFDEIGTVWGPGDGSTTFNVPDLRRRLPLGVGDTNFGLTHSDGQPESGRTPAHHHGFSGSYGGRTGEDTVNHTHANPGGGQGVNAGGQYTAHVLEGSGWPATYGISNGHQHDYSGSVSGLTTGGGIQDYPAFIAVHFIIVT